MLLYAGEKGDELGGTHTVMRACNFHIYISLTCMSVIW